GVPVLRPGVDGQVGLGDHDDSADAERVELVEDHVDDGGLRPLCRLNQSALDAFEIGDGVRVAVEQLEEQVPSQRVQSRVPPLFHPSIYRTSPATPLRASRRALAAKKFFATDKICFTVWSAQSHCKKKTHLRKALDRVAGTPAATENGRRVAAACRRVTFLLRWLDGSVK